MNSLELKIKFAHYLIGRVSRKSGLTAPWIKNTLMKIKKFLTIHASVRNTKWLEKILKREGEKPGSRMLREQHNSLGLEGQ